MVLHLKKLQFPSSKDALWQLPLKLAKWFWRRFLYFVNVFLLFRNYLPLEKGVALHLKKPESPLPKDALCQIWLKVAQWFWKRKWKTEKFMTTSAFGSGELKAMIISNYERNWMVLICKNFISFYPRFSFMKLRQWIFAFLIKIFDETWICFTQWCLVQTLVEIGPVFFRRWWKY